MNERMNEWMNLWMNEKNDGQTENLRGDGWKQSLFRAIWYRMYAAGKNKATKCVCFNHHPLFQEALQNYKDAADETSFEAAAWQFQKEAKRWEISEWEFSTKYMEVNSCLR